VQVASHFVDEEVKDRVGCILYTIRFGFRTNLSNDAVELISGKEIRNVAGRKDIIDVHKEVILNNLGVSQDEQSGGALNTSLHIHSLNISLQISLVVA